MYGEIYTVRFFVTFAVLCAVLGYAGCRGCEAGYGYIHDHVRIETK